MLKGRRIRIYPTKEQEQKLWQHIGACRYIWNWMLAYQENNYKDGGKHLSAFDMIYLIKPLKHDTDHIWMNDISSDSLGTVCRDLDKAYQKFFEGISKHPRFKSRKRSKSTYPVCCNRFYLTDTHCQIQKIGKVKYKTDYDLPIGKDTGKFYNVRIAFDGFKWFVSFEVECESQAPALTDKKMGIDLGVKELATVAFDDVYIVYGNINKSKKMRDLDKRISHTQRSISRKYEANRIGNAYHKTNNIIREEQKLRKLRKRQSDIRHNYLHQVTHALVSMLPRAVVMEDLNVSGMMKNRHLSKAVQAQGFYKFIRQMQYKCEWSGIEFIQADRFYPSSKTCSCCGHVKKDLKLKDRTFICSECGFSIDRDYNAAINLMRYAA